MSTLIAWTNETWNPVTGCSRVSDGCRHCYAEALSLRFGWSKLPWTHANAATNVKERPERLGKPRTWKDPKRIFVNSMSDLFHERVSDAYIAQVFRVMTETDRHTYQILTKRPERAATWPGPWPAHIWQGASVEDRKAVARLDHLRACGAQVKFLSIEPLLEPLGDIDLRGIDWVIVGGESGRGYRPMPHAWVWPIRDACLRDGVAFFFKQSAAHRTEMGTALEHEDGSFWEWRQYPGHVVPPRCVSNAA